MYFSAMSENLTKPPEDIVVPLKNERYRSLKPMTAIISFFIVCLFNVQQRQENC